MTYANLDVYFHMLNHYRKIRKAKAVVDCSSPKGYEKKQCNCKPVNLPRCPVPPPPCSARNRVRSCSPECPPPRPSSCTPRVDHSLCYSAPVYKRPALLKDWYACQNKARELREFKQETGASRMQPQRQPTKSTKNKVVKGSKTGKNDEPCDVEEEPVENERAYDTGQNKSGNVRHEPKKEAHDNNIYDAQEHEYVHFLLKITEDILRNSIYKDTEMEKLFESHIQANLGRLDEDRMRAQIEHLKNELNLPLTKRVVTQCQCDNEQMSDCKCCCAEQKDGICSCNNAKCPGKKLDTKEISEAPTGTNEGAAQLDSKDDTQHLVTVEEADKSNCRCLDEELAEPVNCKCSPGGAWSCNNPNCPGVAPFEKTEDVTTNGQMDTKSDEENLVKQSSESRDSALLHYPVEKTEDVTTNEQTDTKSDKENLVKQSSESSLHCPDEKTEDVTTNEQVDTKSDEENLVKRSSESRDSAPVCSSVEKTEDVTTNEQVDTKSDKENLVKQSSGSRDSALLYCPDEKTEDVTINEQVDTRSDKENLVKQSSGSRDSALLYCRCDDEELAKSTDCKCCPGYQTASGTCSCNNPNCPGRELDTAKDNAPSITTKESDKSKQSIESKDNEDLTKSEDSKRGSEPELSKKTAVLLVESDAAQKSEENLEKSETTKEVGATDKTTTTKTMSSEVALKMFEEPEKPTDQAKPERIGEAETSSISIEKQAESVEPTCEELRCCPEVASTKSETEKETRMEKLAAVEKTFTPSQNTSKAKQGCLDPLHCHTTSEDFATIPIKAKISSHSNHSATTSLHSIVKMVSKDDPDTESQIIFYNADDSEGHCYCTLTLQRTALKIQCDEKDKNIEYILVDGPVCMPRTMLENRTIQVLIENVSSMVLDTDLNSDDERCPSDSQVNLFQQSDKTSEIFDNSDSVSGAIRKVKQMDKLAGCDMTPERETAGEVTAAPAKCLGPILKKKDDGNDVEVKEFPKSVSVFERTMFGDSDNRPTIKEIRVKQEPTAEGTLSKAHVDVCSPDNCPKRGEPQIKTDVCTPDSCPKKAKKRGFPDEEASTFQPAAKEVIHELGSVCSTSSYKKTKDDKEKLEFKERSEERPPFLHNAGITCSVGSCTRDICPKKLKTQKPGATVDSSKQQPSTGVCSSNLQEIRYTCIDNIVEAPTDEMYDECPLSKHPSDCANKYHFLLTDVATSMSSCDLMVLKKGSDGTTSTNETFQQKEYALLVDQEYQIQKLVVVDVHTPSLQTASISESSSGLSAEPQIISLWNEADITEISDKYEAGKLYPAVATSDDDDTYEDLKYVPRKGSESFSEQPLPENIPIIERKTSFQPSLKQNGSLQQSRKSHEVLKVRYSLNRELFDQDHQEVIAALAQPSEAGSIQTERELVPVLTIADKMKEFRNLDDEENENRRFHIAHSDNFEIKRISVDDGAKADEEAQRKAKRCCGLVSTPKGRKKAGSYTGSIDETRTSTTPNI